MARSFIHELKLFLQGFHGKQFLKEAEKVGKKGKKKTRKMITNFMPSILNLSYRRIYVSLSTSHDNFYTSRGCQ